jgi:hypothetical protein
MAAAAVDEVNADIAPPLVCIDNKAHQWWCGGGRFHAPRWQQLVVQHHRIPTPCPFGSVPSIGGLG